MNDLFETYKYCELCHRNLPPNYDDSICPTCQEHQLFQKVKEYIRSTDSNEYQVANHFQIPLILVRKWIREGRIQYKEGSENNKFTMHCRLCGAQINFGTICPKCLKEQNISASALTPYTTNSGNMRHLKPEQKK